MTAVEIRPAADLSTKRRWLCLGRHGPGPGNGSISVPLSNPARSLYHSLAPACPTNPGQAAQMTLFADRHRPPGAADDPNALRRHRRPVLFAWAPGLFEKCPVSLVIIAVFEQR